MVVLYQNGYPTQWSVEKLLENCDIDPATVQFCADYTIKRAGILWKTHSQDEKLKEFINLAEESDIKIARTKFHGRIHSIWFEKEQNRDD